MKTGIELYKEGKKNKKLSDFEELKDYVKHLKKKEDKDATNNAKTSKSTRKEDIIY